LGENWRRKAVGTGGGLCGRGWAMWGLQVDEVNEVAEMTEAGAGLTWLPDSSELNTNNGVNCSRSASLTHTHTGKKAGFQKQGSYLLFKEYFLFELHHLKYLP